ncbi:TPA: Apre_1838 family putative sactipeptide bacteriocin [Clostridium botulinum]|uniref:Apre_1838 family putative sactipeptide bacteriocin n=1 Tax=Clostridium botulinum TaxID=1491 RepID=UPI000D0DA83B|nr:Apre_1838 family putative sactipeptide bacteriocin [Clostridium botulinum]PSM03442.1 putative bacteriocin precursor [Clostridium botulinum]HDK7138549.1 Apre_1838 family putative sactipeptide bacteriocin [Clostridium botulinum]HDK7141878.1 Apre_1838 family putative sactipeptide bacteriocin [Clostridium botulinum]HDK7146306.1 Apre_1838 family putative sactipeptide bacteriocin [Clostridium botulinum]HDK7150011.1 Apre_1838 family putative sactipeptide bacteriocin [Clostridium botulinum]
MKFINPFGRTVGDGVAPQGCMCSLDEYASYRGSDDNCFFHCGCGCEDGSKQHKVGNRKAAANAGRKSE